MSHALWQREMRRLRVVVGALGATLLAFVGRVLVEGLTTSTAIAAVLTVGLFLAGIGLIHDGRRHEPALDEGIRPDDTG